MVLSSTKKLHKFLYNIVRSKTNGISMWTLDIQRQPSLILKITFLEMSEAKYHQFSIQSPRLINFMPTECRVAGDKKIKTIKEKKDKTYIAPILLNMAQW